jgi:hypothetical protein
MTTQPKLDLLGKLRAISDALENIDAKRHLNQRIEIAENLLKSSQSEHKLGNKNRQIELDKYFAQIIAENVEKRFDHCLPVWLNLHNFAMSITADISLKRTKIADKYFEAVEACGLSSGGIMNSFEGPHDYNSYARRTIFAHLSNTSKQK